MARYPPGCGRSADPLGNLDYQPLFVHGEPGDKIIDVLSIGMLGELGCDGCRNNATITADSGRYVVSLWMRTSEEVHQEALGIATAGIPVDRIDLWHCVPLEGSRGWYVQCDPKHP